MPRKSSAVKAELEKCVGIRPEEQNLFADDILESTDELARVRKAQRALKKRKEGAVDTIRTALRETKQTSYERSLPGGGKMKVTVAEKLKISFSDMPPEEE